MKSVSISSLQQLTEQKLKKKMFVKLMWNDTEKITLFIKPKMKINSFIYDEKEGYLFFDDKGVMLDEPIPCVIPQQYMIDGKVSLEALKSGNILINGERLSKEELSHLLMLPVCSPSFRTS